MTLTLENITVEIDNKVLLNNINLKLEKKTSMIMFGPNGSGKTSLLMSIMGIGNYKVSSGKILFDGKDITKMSCDEKANLGLGLSFQNPPEIKGIKLINLLKVCDKKDQKEELSQRAKDLIKKLDMENFLQRDIHVGFSGGERKRAELLQLLIMKPKVLLLDEPDSGVDIESLALMAKEIQKYITEENASAIIITHSGYILDYIEVNKGFVLLDKKIYCKKNPKTIFEDIKRDGYSGCIKCLKSKEEE